MAVYNHGARSGTVPTRIGYAVRSGQSWAQGIVELGQDPEGDDFDRAIDPSVVFDPDTDDYLLAGLLRDEQQEWHVGLARYAASQEEWGDWTSLVEASAIDKPWVVAGEPMQNGREYYIVYLGPGRDPWKLWYLRSTNGGRDWSEAKGILVDDVHVESGFCAQPAAATYTNGPLYVAYMMPDYESFAFLQGDDDGNDVDFTQLLRLCQTGPGFAPQGPKALEISLIEGMDISDYLPKNISTIGIKTTPQLAVDPSDADRLYVVHHDVADEEFDPNAADVDVDVFVTVLERTGPYCWCPSGRIRVNDDDDPNQISDQFLPSIIVDDDGYIHVIFYDDRNYEQDDNAEEPRFDVYYAYSVDGGEHWTNEELEYDPDDPNAPRVPAVNLDAELDLRGFELGEYIGITYYDSAVWTSYAGTWDEEEDEQSLIWSTRIEW